MEYQTETLVCQIGSWQVNERDVKTEIQLPCKVDFGAASWCWRNPTLTFTLGRDNTHTLYTSCVLIIKRLVFGFWSTKTKTVDYREDYMMQDCCDASNKDFSQTCVECTTELQSCNEKLATMPGY